MKYIIDTDKLPCNNGMNCTTCPFWPIDAICEIKEQVKNLPKYEERPHGEWIPFKWDDKYSTKIPLPKGSDSHMEEYWDEEFMCSICGKAHHARKFCPNCGADMRKEGGEK